MDRLGRLEPIKWIAQIINWWQMAGHGDTREKALASLRANFNIKLMEKELETLKRSSRQYADNARLQKELDKNAQVWEEAQRQIATKKPQDESNVGNRGRLNDLFEGQSH